jgi:hypothetical protein
MIARIYMTTGNLVFGAIVASRSLPKTLSSKALAVASSRIDLDRFEAILISTVL